MNSHDTKSNNPPLTLPAIETVVLCLETFICGDESPRTQKIILQKGYLAGVDQHRTHQLAQRAILKNKNFRDNYGGGVIFESEGYILTDPYSNKEEFIEYEHPLNGFERWGRLYLSMKQQLYFELNVGVAQHGLKQEAGVYGISVGFSVRRFFGFESEKYLDVFGVEEGGVCAPNELYDVSQTLRVEKIVRKRAGVK